jgi:hypothetical protein
MKRLLAVTLIVLFAAASVTVFASEIEEDRGELTPRIRGYAGPGWSVLFGSGGTVETASLGAVMFRTGENLYL